MDNGSRVLPLTPVQLHRTVENVSTKHQIDVMDKDNDGKKCRLRPVIAGGVGLAFSGAVLSVPLTDDVVGGDANDILRIAANVIISSTSAAVDLPKLDDSGQFVQNPFFVIKADHFDRMHRTEQSAGSTIELGSAIALTAATSISNVDIKLIVDA